MSGTGSAGVDVSDGVLARNTVYNLLGQGLPLVVAIVAVPILLRGLGAGAFGILGLVWMFVTVFGEVGFARAGTRFAAEALGAGQHDRLPGIVGIVLRSQIVLGVVVGGGFCLVAGSLARDVLTIEPALIQDARICFLLLGVSLPVLMVGAAFRGFLEAQQRFGVLNLIRFVVSTLNYLLPAVIVLMGGGLVAVVGALLGVRAAGALAMGWPVRHLGRGPDAPDPAGPEARDVLGFAAWVTVSTVVSPVLVYLDRFLLGALVSVVAVGVYTAPYEVVTRILLVPAAMASTLFPAVSAIRGMGGTVLLRRTSLRAVSAIGLVVGPLALAFAVGARPLLDVWLGTSVEPDMVVALRLLALGVLANALAFVPFSVIQGLGRADVTGRIHMVELPLHAVLAWILISRFGVPGAAAAWSLRATADAVAMFVAQSRLVGREA